MYFLPDCSDLRHRNSRQPVREAWLAGGTMVLGQHRTELTQVTCSLFLAVGEGLLST